MRNRKQNAQNEIPEHKPVDQGEEKVDIIQGAIKSSKYLVGLQFAIKLVTFMINLIIIRFTIRAYGIINIKLEFVYLTILFLSREGLRIASLKTKSTKNIVESTKQPLVDKKETNKKGNTANKNGTKKQVSWVTFTPLTIGILLSGMFIAFYSENNSGSTKSREQQGIVVGVWMYCIAALFELASEPLFLYCRDSMVIETRVISEMLATIVKGIVTVFLLGMAVYIDMSDGVDERTIIVIYGIAQILYSATVLVGYIYYSGNNLEIDWTPISVEQIKSIVMFNIQSLLKHVLTEGDRIMIEMFVTTGTGGNVGGSGEKERTSLMNQTDSGVYALTTNYGSLPARLLFQPIEESSRVMFSKLVGQRKNNDSDDSGGNKEIEKEKGKGKVEHYKERNQVMEYLGVMIKCYIIFGILAIMYIPLYIPRVLQLLMNKGGGAGGGNETIELMIESLVLYLGYYLPIMGVNGIIESFTIVITDFTRTTIKGDKKHKKERFGEGNRMLVMMVIFSVLYCGFTYILFNYEDKFYIIKKITGGKSNGTTKLIIANMFNMAIRIIYGSYVIYRYFSKRTNGTMVNQNDRIIPVMIKMVLPNIKTLVLLLGNYVGLMYILSLNGMENGLRKVLVDFMVGVGSGLLSLLIIYRNEWESIKQRSIV